MSDIVLSASVRQNLLSLQSTADLLATTQNRLATGKKVNTALDNPTNFFTAASLDNRASDISNLLDGIGNGVQVLQAANTGITSLQSLVDSAKSIANQVLQTPVGYSTKSSVSSAAVGGATANNLLMQFQSDILQAPVVRPTVTETTELGAAYLAGLAVGYWHSVEDIQQQWQIDKRFSPAMNAEHAEQLLKGWRRAVRAAIAWADNP